MLETLQKSEHVQTHSISLRTSSLLEDDFLNISPPLCTFRPSLLQQRYMRLCTNLSQLKPFLSSSPQLAASTNTGTLPKKAAFLGRSCARLHTALLVTAHHCLTQPQQLEKEGNSGATSLLTAWVLGQKKQGSCVSCNTRHNFTGDLSCFGATCEDASVWHMQYKGCSW